MAQRKTIMVGTRLDRVDAERVDLAATVAGESRAAWTRRTILDGLRRDLGGLRGDRVDPSEDR